ncbi:hypothetical protein ERO13_D01G211001v2 [Gossypium hirsutum]|uniref:Uncharacterized protein n=1 Tax=Gossypium tomentosum TaxID=34277 RepID=A0A5D2MDI7_GOSTO|nr:hypothetical protein ERO13_D01G211001v2 [Gossypium hirsutum]TYH89547.1 hypothetical protein ES332_D01G269700v1 [Gossypium tomentosum]
MNECRKVSNPSPTPSYILDGFKTSGNSASPSRYLTACLMLGRAIGTSFEQIRPNLSTTNISSSLYLSLSLMSTTSKSLPCVNFSQTQSINTSSSCDTLDSMGLRPHATSSKKAPKA